MHVPCIYASKRHAAMYESAQIPCVAACCSVLQCAVMCCSVLQCVIYSVSVKERDV